VSDVVRQNAENEKRFSSIECLIGLSKLNAILNKTQGLPEISNMLQAKASEFHLTDEQKEGADDVILDGYGTKDNLDNLKNSPKAKEGLIWSWLTYAWSVVVGIWNYFCGAKASN